MKKILIFILFITTFLNAEKQIFGMDENEFKTRINNSMIKGATLGAVDIKTDKQKVETCNKKFRKMFTKLNKLNVKFFNENMEIRIKLKENHINYNIIIKQRMKKIDVNIDQIRNESCSKNYFKNKVNFTKLRIKREQENIILKDLMSMNQLVLTPKLDEYYQSSKKIEPNRDEAKKELRRQLNSNTVDTELLEAIKDVD